MMRSAYSVLAVTSLGLMLILINATSVTVALPALSDDFGAPAALADWFLLAFLLANTASILVFGRISDMIGRKRIYLWGMAAFMVLSGLAVIAPDAGTFIAVRALQGVSAATIVANTSALVADAFPAKRLAYGLSLNLTAAAVANTIGPAVGGVLVSTFGWQSVFLVNVPFGVAALALGIRFLPSTRSGAAGERFDYAGAVLSAAGLAAVLYGVNRVSASGPGDPWVWACLALGAVLITLFVLVERRVRHPLVDVALVNDRKRALAYGAAFFNSFARAGVTLLVVLHQQIVGGRSAAEAGVVIMVMALAMVLATPLAGRLSGVLTVRTLAAVGGGLLVLGLAGLAFFSRGADVLTVSLWLVLVGVGIGVFTTPNTAAIMHGVQPARRTVANAVRSMLYNSAATLGTSVSLLVITASGIDSYAEPDASPAAEAGFTLAMLVLAAGALLALVCALARGGPWRTSALPQTGSIAVVPRVDRREDEAAA
ncbi:MFS transporter [Rathayibacter sp. VKM Ac-2803]|uniref:MFS transporter n=1 Tax=Rathayibacter sp. VKM Ac-2803 TaxID=2609256 RepID=UPI001358C9AF|nr:MFS transporter [Rathayibacter sp. VKM Ac-2803]MWV48284.1 MFS transporter [Rathayibacter sp. VKM Ac-2803]